MTWATLVVFARLYGMGTDLPAYPEPSLFGTPIVLAHGATLETRTWHSVGASGEMTTRWRDTPRGPEVSSVDYRVGVSARWRALRLRLEHESDHNSDQAGRSLRGNYLGLEVRL